MKPKKVLQVLLLCLIFAIGLRVLVNAVLDPGMIGVDWPDHKRALTYCFVDSVPDDVKRNVDTAAARWNQANTGWSFTRADSCKGDIKVKYEDKTGPSSFSWQRGAGATIAKAEITMRNGAGSGTRRAMHEMGHAARLGHSPECGQTIGQCGENPDSPCRSINNVMAAHQYFGSTDLSEDDIKEAQTSDSAGVGGKKQVKATPKDGQKDTPKQYMIEGEEGTDLNLPQAQGISIRPFFPGSLIVDPLSIHWNANSIFAIFIPTVLAHPQEGFEVDINYFSGDTSRFWGLIWVTDLPLPQAVFPHAVAGPDTAVPEGEVFELDGTHSYHDDPKIKLSHYCWSFYDEGTYGAGAPLSLPFGVYPMVLTVYDQFGQISSDTMHLRVIYHLTCGDVNGDRSVSVSDAVYLINYLFKGGPAPNPLQLGDLNGNGQVDIADVVYLINYLFKGGPAPLC